MNRIVALATLQLIALAWCEPSTAIDRVSHGESKSIALHQWDVADIAFHVGAIPEKPIDVEFTATFESDAGMSLSINGFYDGVAAYVVRFTPSSSGVWKYTTKSSLSELNGKSGQLDVQSASQQRRGGVVVDPQEPTRFVYQNGDSYYPIAFEADWLFALDAENADDIPATRTFVNTLAENGFNQVVMNVFAYDVDWKKDTKLDPKYDYGSPKVFPFNGNNSLPDYSELNVDYFKRLDRAIDYLDQKGIVAHLMIYVWNKRVAWPEANSVADNRYFDYVVKRYQAFPNLVWDISKEALGYGHSDVGYITERIERLRKLDVYDRLVTVHDYGYCRKFPENVDFVSVQLWSSELYNVMRNVCEAIPRKPILNIEHGGYERGPYVVFNGNYTSPEVCLERAYQCVFAGTFPTHYWNGAAWNVIIPDIASLPEDQRPRLEYYGYMQKFVDRFNVNQLSVEPQRSNAGFCLHGGDNRYLYYVPSECDFIGLRLKEFQGKKMTVTWFNPRTGEYSEPEEQKIEQWPALAIPRDGGFHVLIIEVKE